MTAWELIIDSIITDDMEAGDGKYEYYSIMPDGKFIFMKDKAIALEWPPREMSCSLEQIAVDDHDDFKHDAPFYIDYAKLEFLRDIVIEGTIPGKDACQRNQFIAIRGTCDHACPQCIAQYAGYALREIPSCNRDLVGTTVFTAKWAEISDVLQDVFMWLKQCKGLDILIINFDFTPNKDNPELDFEWVCYGIRIQGNTVTFLTDKKCIEKLYKKYARTYACMDYSMEERISVPEEGFNFVLEKPVDV